MQSRKVLFLIPSLDPGGIETYLLRFLAFAKNKIDVVIVVRNKEQGILFEKYKQYTSRIFFMPFGYINVLSWLKYFIFLKKQNFNVVCDFNANFAGIPLAIARVLGIHKRIAFYRQGSNHFRINALKLLYNKWLNRLVYKNATSILSNSQSAIDYFFPYRKKIDSRFRVIYNGIDSRVFNSNINCAKLRESIGIPLSAYVVGHSGRLDKAKNHETILDVATELVKDNSNIYILMCGKGTELLQEKIENLGIEKNVRLLGYRSDVLDLLQVMDLFYFPSITEGQPNALIEAMMAGLPFVASNINAIKEILPEELHEFLVNPTDRASSISKIKEIMLKIEGKESKDFRKNWAIRVFDADKRFSEFLHEINQS